MKLLSIIQTASLASAIPTSSSPPSSCTKEIADFDDLGNLPVTANPIPDPYKGLYFQGFNAASVPSGTTAVGTVPHSGNNYAVSNAVDQSMQGTASWTAVNYPGSSNNNTFSLESFYYSCVLSLQNGAAASPAACNIAITAFKTGFDTTQTVEVGSQTFTYNPTTSIGRQQQAFGSFSSAFTNISYVILQFTVADQTVAAAQADLNIQVDDVKYTVCNGGS